MGVTYEEKPYGESQSDAAHNALLRQKKKQAKDKDIHKITPL